MSDQWTTESDEVADGTEQSVEDVATLQAGEEASVEEADTPAAETDADTSATAEFSDTAADEAAQDEAPVEEAPVDPVKEFKDKLASQFGDWYVVHSYAGYENRVKANLENLCDHATCNL